MRNLIFLFLFTISFTSSSQNFKEYLDSLNSNKLIYFKDSLLSNNKLSLDELKYLQFQKKIKFKGYVDTLILNFFSKKNQSILKNIIIGDANLYSFPSKDSLSFDSYNKALEESVDKKDYILVSECIKKILYQLLKNRKNLNLLPKYLNIYKENLNTVNDSATYFYFKTINDFDRNKIQKSINQIQVSLPVAIRSKNKYLISKYLQFNGILYRQLSNRKVELENYTKALNYIEKEKTYLFNIEKFGLYVNIASTLYEQGNFKESLKLYNKANLIEIPSYRIIEKVKFNNILSNNYFKLKDYKNAYIYLQKANSHKEELNEFKKDIALNDINVKYKTAEKEKELIKEKQNTLISEQKRKETLRFLYGSLVFLLLGGIIAYLSLKNSKKKRLLAEQQKELEKQKNLTLLKEQEINTINAMVTGQEKERVRIAEDLHDNIGSVLATLKLHFENLKLNREKKHFNQDELYEKTEKLIDETYLKVRSIAHAKNAGVIANQGLLVAVKIMAEKISAANQLKIEIIDFGLEQRLDTNTELTLFRIIQELTTNIIKHAEASEATVSISQFNDALNIIIEDNGKGFDPKKIKAKTGMGLHSIQKRIEHLEGTFQIDSSSKGGTSIILNIPI